MFDAQPTGRTPEQVKADLDAARQLLARIERDLAADKAARRRAEPERKSMAPIMRAADYADDPMKAMVREYDRRLTGKGEHSIFECRPR